MAGAQLWGFMESNMESRRKSWTCGCGDARLWGGFLIVMGTLWGLSLAGLIGFNFWPYIGVIAILFVGIGMLLPREGAGRTL